MAAIDDITITSDVDAFLYVMRNDLSKLDGKEAVGSIRNDVTYGDNVNSGDSKRAGRHFVENSVPGIQAILAKKIAAIQGVPYAAKTRKAIDEAMIESIDQELRPRTPRSNIETKPASHYVTPTVKTHLQDSYYVTDAVVF